MSAMNRSASDTQLQLPGSSKRRSLAPPAKHLGQLIGQKVHGNGAHASGMLTNLRGSLRDLDAEIAADEESLKEMKRHLGQMGQDMDRLAYLIDEEKKFLAAMADEKSLGGLMAQFDGIGDNVQTQYVGLRVKHKKGIELLKKEFGYHPAYKRGYEVEKKKNGREIKRFTDNEFSATYYSMNPNPNRPR